MIISKLLVLKGDDFQVITATRGQDGWNIQGEHPWNFTDRAAMTAHLIREGLIPLWKDWKEV